MLMNTPSDFNHNLNRGQNFLSPKRIKQDIPYRYVVTHFTDFSLTPYKIFEYQKYGCLVSDNNLHVEPSQF